MVARRSSPAVHSCLMSPVGYPRSSINWSPSSFAPEYPSNTQGYIPLIHRFILHLSVLVNPCEVLQMGDVTHNAWIIRGIADSCGNHALNHVPVSPFRARPMFSGFVIKACLPPFSRNQMIASILGAIEPLAKCVPSAR
jgi:hypothetical protein